jgi:propionyl-CoA synthetase
MRITEILSWNNEPTEGNPSDPQLDTMIVGSGLRGRKPMTGYAGTYRRSIEQPEDFWAEAAEAIDWDRRWDRVLDANRPPFVRWFPGAGLNTCWNAVDRHVAAGNGDRVALIWDSPVTGQVRQFTYRELRDEVACLAGVLTSLKVVKGDRVLIYMPMVPEAAFLRHRGQSHRSL